MSVASETHSHEASGSGERGKIKRRELIGIITSDKMQKTRVVLVERRLSHAKYGKYMTSRTKYKAHDEKNEYKTGDRVSSSRAAVVARQALARRKAHRAAARANRKPGKQSWFRPRQTLDVADNSGAKKIMCIRVLGGTKRKYASLGDVIVVSIKEAIRRQGEERRDRQGGDRPHRKRSRVRMARTSASTRTRRCWSTRQRADRDAHLRAGRARAARQTVHEDHLAGFRRSCDARSQG